MKIHLCFILCHVNFSNSFNVIILLHYNIFFSLVQFDDLDWLIYPIYTIVSNLHTFFGTELSSERWTMNQIGQLINFRLEKKVL